MESDLYVVECDDENWNRSFVGSQNRLEMSKRTTNVLQNANWCTYIGNNKLDLPPDLFWGSDLGGSCYVHYRTDDYTGTVSLEDMKQDLVAQLGLQ